MPPFLSCATAAASHLTPVARGFALLCGIMFLAGCTTSTVEVWTPPSPSDSASAGVNSAISVPAPAVILEPSPALAAVAPPPASPLDPRELEPLDPSELEPKAPLDPRELEPLDPSELEPRPAR